MKNSYVTYRQSSGRVLIKTSPAGAAKSRLDGTGTRRLGIEARFICRHAAGAGYKENSDFADAEKQMARKAQAGSPRVTHVKQRPWIRSHRNLRHRRR